MKISFSLHESQGRICRIDIGKKAKGKKSVLEALAEKEISDYLEGRRKEFTFPILVQGTDFELSVWKAMMKIPYGKTASYKEIAIKIGKPKASRAVANACGRNPLPLVIPCHRVVASNGLGGFTPGIHIKKILLDLEKEQSKLKKL